MSEEKEPTRIEQEQLDWMNKEGLTIHMTLVPDMNRVMTADRPRGVDPSNVQLFIRINTGEEVKIIHSDFVRNTRGNLKRLLREQFKLASAALLDHRFGTDPEETTED